MIWPDRVFLLPDLEEIYYTHWIKKSSSISAVDITEIFRRAKRVLDVHSDSIILLHFISRLVYCYGYVVRYVVHAFKLIS